MLPLPLKEKTCRQRLRRGPAVDRSRWCRATSSKVTPPLTCANTSPRRVAPASVVSRMCGVYHADAWYCILEGTDQISIAESQARALVDLLASFAVRGPHKREILLAVDELSVVSRRLPIWQLYERARALGLAVQVSAQSWQGLGASEDERRRIAASAEGGIWLLRTPEPEPIAAFAGTRKVVDTTRRLARFPFWAHAGSSRLADRPVVDVALIRALDVGQAAYIYRGGVTYVLIKRLVGAPAAVGQRTVHEPAPMDPAGGETGEADLAAAAIPDVSAVLDTAFGAERPT